MSDATRAGRYVIVADVLVDGTGGEPLERPAVAVEHGRIASVERRDGAWRAPRDVPVLDAEGCTLLPGLIDAHVHLAFAGATSAEIIAFAEQADEPEVVAAMRRHAGETLAAGVTAVRDCGAPGRSALLLRREREQGRVAAPRLLVAGRPVTTPAGHCHWMGRIAESAQELREAVRELADEGVDVVKVMATGGMMTPGSDPYTAQYSADELRALVEEAHARGRPVAAHVLCAAGLRNAVAAGVDTVEHGWTITGRRQERDDATVRALVEAGIAGSVTAHSALRALVEQGDLDELRRRLEPHRRLREAGGTLLVHSDAGTPGTAFGDFALSVEAFQLGMGVTVVEAVAAATSAPARVLGLGGEVGSVAPGWRADLLLAEGDARDDRRALRRPWRVLQDGRTVAREGALVGGHGDPEEDG